MAAWTSRLFRCAKRQRMCTDNVQCSWPESGLNASVVVVVVVVLGLCLHRCNAFTLNLTDSKICRVESVHKTCRRFVLCRTKFVETSQCTSRQVVCVIRVGHIRVKGWKELWGNPFCMFFVVWGTDVGSDGFNEQCPGGTPCHRTHNVPGLARRRTIGCLKVSVFPGPEEGGDQREVRRCLLISA